MTRLTVYVVAAVAGRLRLRRGDPVSRYARRSDSTPSEPDRAGEVLSVPETLAASDSSRVYRRRARRLRDEAGEVREVAPVVAARIDARAAACLALVPPHPLALVGSLLLVAYEAQLNADDVGGLTWAGRLAASERPEVEP